MAKGRIYQVKKGKNNSWSIDCSCDGERIRQVIGSKRLAHDVLHKRLTEVAENKHLDVRKGKKIKFKIFAEEYMERHAKPNKRSWQTADVKYLRNLVPFFGEKALTEISVKLIEDYRNQRRVTISIASVNREVALLKAMLNKAILWDYALENPAKKIKMYAENNWRTRYLSEDEIVSLVGQCEGQLKAIVIIALHTGMRKSEIKNLEWNRINLEESFIVLNKTKNGRTRFLRINEDVREALSTLKKHPKTDYVFYGEGGLPYDFRKSFETALKKSDIFGFRFHDLRHTFASHLAMAGIALNTISELLGHKSIGMTKRYAHLSPAYQQEAVNALSNKIGKNSAIYRSVENKLNIDELLTSFK